ncbi:unnamed protein product [Psylliodes chrysocephalus]|uniref:Glutamate/phenylalanine/leucine/valine/L-tryptophan dehydrogenase C-terminal domain-containing protein n=1 Tax=Psylliodes chrysocephalus TaxID=3402493 RepID=A0A9P0D6Q4_9CUCU|nr:unnamed protein product [Psylliodes chrysocephala]
MFSHRKSSKKRRIDGEIHDASWFKRKNLYYSKFIFKGFEKLGAALATFLVQNGAICIGIRDEDAQIYDPEGLDVEKLYENKLYDGTIKFYPGAILDSSDIIYKEKSDILIFSADHKSLNWYTPEDIRARIIIEATDNATMPRAPIISKEKSQLVVPDIYACPGANVDSYVEFLWNLQQLGKLDNKMLRISLGVNKTGVEQYQLEEEAQLPVQTGSPLSAIVNLSIVNRAAILDTLEYILAEKKIFNYTDLFTIGTDIRAAALIIGINNIFKSLYQHKRFF